MVYTVMYIVCKTAFKLQICLHAIYVKCTEMLMCQDLMISVGSACVNGGTKSQTGGRS